MRREGASEAAPEAVRRAVGGGCQSGWGRLRSVMPLRLALGVTGTVAGRRLGALESPPPPPPRSFQCTPAHGGTTPVQPPPLPPGPKGPGLPSAGLGQGPTGDVMDNVVERRPAAVADRTRPNTNNGQPPPPRSGHRNCRNGGGGGLNGAKKGEGRMMVAAVRTAARRCISLGDPVHPRGQGGRPLLSGWLILYRGGGGGQRPKKSLCT